MSSDLKENIVKTAEQSAKEVARVNGRLFYKRIGLVVDEHSHLSQNLGQILSKVGVLGKR